MSVMVLQNALQKRRESLNNKMQSIANDKVDKNLVLTNIHAISFLRKSKVKITSVKKCRDENIRIYYMQFLTILIIILYYK